MAQTLYFVSLCVILAGSIHRAEPTYSFYYRAIFVTNGTTTGNATTRGDELANTSQDIIDELTRNETLEFSVASFNATLELILNSIVNPSFSYPVSVYVVYFRFQNSTKTAAEFTNILRMSSIETTINSTAVSAYDFDECRNNQSECSDVSTCTNSDGSYSCTCPNTYADRSTNGISGTTCELPTNHTCSPNQIDCTSYFPYFSDLGINETDLLLGNCSGSLSGDYLTFRGTCNPTITNNDTHLLYSWNLTNVHTSGDVTIGTYVTIPISCSFLVSGNVSNTYNGSLARPVVFPNDLFVNLGTSVVDINVNAFTDSSFTTALSAGSTINTDTDMNFQIGPNSFISENLKTVCETLSSSAADTVSDNIQLISGGCRVASTSNNAALLNTLSINTQGTGSQVELGLKAHFHSNSQTTSLNFGIRICLETGGSSCEPDCAPRRRRTVLSFRSRRQIEAVASGSGIFTFVRDPSDVCNRDCGSGACVYDALRREECVCTTHAYKDHTGSCILFIEEAEQKSKPLTDAEEISQNLLIGIGCLLAIIIISIGIWYTMRKKLLKKALQF
ncbi:uncharacterized protein LOC143465221 [Clavelina lepadiformis]|uniref:uncharacterized protein LOC143465221 n=1 Tax=Clavelina lepadiformis TaxID=159417 RepID=UPI004041AD86